MLSGFAKRNVIWFSHEKCYLVLPREMLSGFAWKLSCSARGMVIWYFQYECYLVLPMNCNLVLPREIFSGFAWELLSGFAEEL